MSVDTFFIIQACIAPSVTGVSSPATCFGASDGSVDITVKRWLTSYVITWSNGANSEDIFGLIAGTYTVTVSDAQLSSYNNLCCC
ncbi:MAG: SprB repeat-containing protein [Bacteroidetes bacterium]|nr:SprB repeat-containing protein [Bacteroidota bacterium]